MIPVSNSSRSASAMGLALAVCVLAAPGPATANDEVGKALAALDAELLQAGGGYEAGDAAQAAQEKPVVFVLIPHAKWDRPVGRFLKILDEKLADYSASAEVRAIWLSGDADATKEYLPRIVQSLQFQKTTLGVHSGEDGPNGWQPGSDVQALVVVGHQGKVAARFPFGSVNETDVAQVGEAVAKALDQNSK